MKGEKINLKEEARGCWNPDLAKLPPVIIQHLDKWLTPLEQRRRDRAITCALLQMERNGEIKECNIALKLVGGQGKGNIIKKYFTFYKTVLPKENKRK